MQSKVADIRCPGKASGLRKQCARLAAVAMGLVVGGCHDADKVAEAAYLGTVAVAGAATVAHSSVKAYENAPPSGRDAGKLEANEAELRNGLLHLRVGMTVGEVGKLIPHTLGRKARRDIRKAEAFTAELHGYRLDFKTGVLVSFTPPPTSPPAR